MPLEADGVTVTFQGEEAGYHNVLGWYKMGDDGQPTDPQVIWNNASESGSGGNLAEGTSVTLDGLAPGQQFGFFIIQDGADLVSGQSHINDSLHFGDDGNLNFTSDDGHARTIDDDKLLFTGSNLNPDGINHAVSGVDGDQLMIGFEDLTNGGDKDFNDVMISVKYEGTPAPQTVSHDSFTFTAQDSGGAPVADHPADTGEGYTVTDSHATFNVTIDHQSS
jgi:hypothetical protein